MTGSRRIRQKKKKFRIWRVFTLIMLLSIIGGGSYFAYNLVNHAKSASKSIFQELDINKVPNHREEKIELTKDPFTVLLVGIEDQEGGERSDVIMLATVNPQTEEIYLLSIPRDTKTYIPELGYETKINHSYGSGGIESTISTVHELLDVPIDYYISTNFEGFEDIVDTLEGVTVDVPFTFKAQLTGSLKWKTFYKGEMELNGNEALAYVRMRKSDPKGDMGRNERQQQVIKAIVDKGTSFSTITKIDDLMDDLGDNVKTNIPPSKFASFVKLYSKLKDTNIQHLKLDGYDEYIDGVYYYIPSNESIEEVGYTLNNALGSNIYVEETSQNKQAATQTNENSW
jgi:polyisoprenyl-teichoic acid--peptidoglycan teichoic acid transferase